MTGREHGAGLDRPSAITIQSPSYPKTCWRSARRCLNAYLIAKRFESSRFGAHCGPNWRHWVTLCHQGRNPSLTFANSAPPPRQEVWPQRDVLRLVQRAWREGYCGLAALIAVAWDTMLSPVDVRSLTVAQRGSDGHGTVFSLARAKTGRAAAGTLSRWSEAILDTYLEKLGVELHAATPIFWTRGGASTTKDGRPWPPRPYSSDRLGIDFPYIRALAFGPHDQRQIADMRRSGAVEAMRGDATPAKLSTKMANTLSASNRRHRTYIPVDLRLYGTWTTRANLGACGNETGPKSCNSGRSRSCNRSNPPHLSL
jgi:hypothetical protein